MKICYFADGESIHVIRWCRHFASLGHEVHLISFKKVSIENVTMHFIDTGAISVEGGNWKVILKLREVKKILWKIKPDIFHSLYATSYGLVGALCNYHPYVLTALGSDVLVSPKNSFLYKKILQFVFKRADWITAMADHMREKILELGASSSKTETVIFGIDTSIFNLEYRKLNDSKFIITSTRNLEPVYNLPHLIEAVAKARNQIPNLFLNIIGSGTLRNELEYLVKRKNMGDIVKFFGKTSQEELVQTLKSSHVFISTSLSDGNNISLNEAMACGNVCIATDIPANRQWIKNSENGFLVPINDIDGLSEKILAAYQHYNDLSSRFIPLNEKIISERADWKKNMESVEKKYLSLINKK
ncbi:MAG TPA: glycosyltransferase [Bacteroidia bacterium]